MEAEGQFWARDWPKHISRISHHTRNSWLFGKEKVCQQRHPGLLFFHKTYPLVWSWWAVSYPQKTILSSTESSCWTSSVNTAEQQQIHFTFLANGFPSWKRDSWEKKQTLLSVPKRLTWVSTHRAAPPACGRARCTSGELLCPQIQDWRLRAVVEEVSWCRIIAFCALILLGKNKGNLATVIQTFYANLMFVFCILVHNLHLIINFRSIVLF